MVIQRAPGNAHLLQNIVGAGAVEALLAKQLIRRIQYFVPALLGFLHNSHARISLLAFIDRLSVGNIMTYPP
ncbi:hypothetical protein D3C81_2134190 [compost metagenome]